MVSVALKNRTVSAVGRCGGTQGCLNFFNTGWIVRTCQEQLKEYRWQGLPIPSDSIRSHVFGLTLPKRTVIVLFVNRKFHPKFVLKLPTKIGIIFAVQIHKLHFILVSQVSP